MSERLTDEQNGERCHVCSRVYDDVWWCGDADLWVAVYGLLTGDETRARGGGGLLCPSCFTAGSVAIERTATLRALVNGGPCAACDGIGCDIHMCKSCGEDFHEPCDRHVAAGHVPADDPYGDGVDCTSCCPDCIDGRTPGLAERLLAVGKTYLEGGNETDWIGATAKLNAVIADLRRAGDIL